MSSIGICAIFKDEAKDLLEWAAYHLAVGVDHIVLFDNGSRDGGAELIQSSNLGQSVTVLDWPERPGQMSAYQYFCQQWADLFEWVAFIDVDEFIHPLNHNRLEEVLAKYQLFSGVLVQWLTFGPSGHQKRPNGLVIENYNHRLPETHARCRWVKSIVRTSDILGTGDGPHAFRMSGDYCNTLGEKTSPFAQLPRSYHELLVINHYFTKSREDWDQKMSRGRVSTKESGYREDQYHETAQASSEIDDRIHRFVPLVNSRLTRR